MRLSQVAALSLALAGCGDSTDVTEEATADTAQAGQTEAEAQAEQLEAAQDEIQRLKGENTRLAEQEAIIALRANASGQLEAKDCTADEKKLVTAAQRLVNQHLSGVQDAYERSKYYKEDRRLDAGQAMSKKRGVKCAVNTEPLTYRGSQSPESTGKIIDAQLRPDGAIVVSKSLIEDAKTPQGLAELAAVTIALNACDSPNETCANYTDTGALNRELPGGQHGLLAKAAKQVISADPNLSLERTLGDERTLTTSQCARGSNFEGRGKCTYPEDEGGDKAEVFAAGEWSSGDKLTGEFHSKGENDDLLGGSTVVITVAGDFKGKATSNRPTPDNAKLTLDVTKGASGKIEMVEADITGSVVTGKLDQTYGGTLESLEGKFTWSVDEPFNLPEPIAGQIDEVKYTSGMSIKNPSCLMTDDFLPCDTQTLEGDKDLPKGSQIRIVFDDGGMPTVGQSAILIENAGKSDETTTQLWFDKVETTDDTTAWWQYSNPAWAPDDCAYTEYKYTWGEADLTTSTGSNKKGANRTECRDDETGAYLKDTDPQTYTVEPTTIKMEGKLYTATPGTRLTIPEEGAEVAYEITAPDGTSHVARATSTCFRYEDYLPCGAVRIVWDDPAMPQTATEFQGFFDSAGNPITLTEAKSPFGTMRSSAQHNIRSGAVNGEPWDLTWNVGGFFFEQGKCEGTRESATSCVAK